MKAKFFFEAGTNDQFRTTICCLFGVFFSCIIGDVTVSTVN